VLFPRPEFLPNPQTEPGDARSISGKNLLRGATLNEVETEPLTPPVSALF
jgi:hypothetical protein